jgi:hypothetical protein
LTEDRHAEHRRVDPERYGNPLARPPMSARGRLLVVVVAGAVVVVVLVAVLLVSR